MAGANNPNDVCASCGKQKSAKTGLSLTQWIFEADTCSCQSKPQFRTRPDLCKTCGKQRSFGRFGSMTQWIFRHDLCDCNTVEHRPKDQHVNRSVAQNATKTDNGMAHDTIASVEASKTDVNALQHGPIDYHGLPPDSFPFDRFRIITEKGRGKSGIVYEAWDCLLQRRVAIKTINAQILLSNEELIKIQNEARTSGRLKHPALVQVLDLGVAPSGRPYLVSDFIHGTTLGNRIREHGPLNPKEALPVFLQICAGVNYAHQQGVLHRDLKSSNVMLSPSDDDVFQVKIIDFGIARVRQSLSDSSARIAEIGGIEGTPCYMSPEQATGRFDVRSEIYSIGVVMFETLAGQVPFEGTTVLDTLNLHGNSPVPSLAELRPDLDCPDGLESIVRRCLKKDPVLRFQSVAELQQQLQLFSDANQVDSLPLETEPSISVTSPATKNPRRFLVAAVAAVAGLTLCYWLITAVSSILSNPSSNEPSAPTAPDPEEVLSKIPLIGKEMPWSERGAGEYCGSMWISDADFKALENIPNLEYVESSVSPEVSGEGLSYIKHDHLRYLTLGSTKLSDVAFDHIKKMTHLEALSIGDTARLTQASLKVFPQLPELSLLRISNVKLPQDALYSFAQAPKLDSLVLMNKAPGSAPTDWKPLFSLKRLKFLAISNYDFGNSELARIDSLSNLKTLKLSDLQLGDAHMDKLKSISLKVLDLSFNSITDKSLSDLASMKSLNSLDLTGCRRLTASRITRLREQLPQCSIERETEEKPVRAWSLGRIIAERSGDFVRPGK